MGEFRVCELAAYASVCGVLAVGAGSIVGEWSDAGWWAGVPTAAALSMVAGLVAA